MKNRRKIQRMSKEALVEFLARDIAVAIHDIKKRFGVVELSSRDAWKWWLDQEAKEFNS